MLFGFQLQFPSRQSVSSSSAAVDKIIGFRSQSGLGMFIFFLSCFPVHCCFGDLWSHFLVVIIHADYNVAAGP
jgi:hypothetical protein